jgi:phospholipid N-methyltransferase
MRDHGRLLTAFARSLGETGAVAPSSRQLARVVTEDMGLERAETVVELGAGTGVVTEAIEGRVGAGTLVMALELNPNLAQPLVARFPGLQIVNAGAERLEEVLKERGREGADSIISCLPWALFSEDRQEQILGVVSRCLYAGGRFAAISCVHAAVLPAGRRFRRSLGQRFAAVEETPIVWRNLPPAFVFRCTL